MKPNALLKRWSDTSMSSYTVNQNCKHVHPVTQITESAMKLCATIQQIHGSLHMHISVICGSCQMT